MSGAGRKRGPGRPPKSPEDVLAVQVGVHLTAEEAALVHRAAELDGERSFSSWARVLLVAAAKRSIALAEAKRRESPKPSQRSKTPRSNKDT